MKRPSLAIVQVGSALPEEALPYWDELRSYMSHLEALQAAARREALEECLDAIDRVRKADFGDRRDTASALGAIRAVEVAIHALIGEKENLTKEK